MNEQLWHYSDCRSNMQKKIKAKKENRKEI